MQRIGAREAAQGGGRQGEECQGDWLARASEENTSTYQVRGLEKAFERIRLHDVRVILS